MWNQSKNHILHNMCNILRYIKAYQKVSKVLVKPMLIVNVDTNLWSVLAKFINNVFTETLGQCLSLL